MTTKNIVSALDKLAAQLALTDRERALAEGVARGLTPQQSGEAAGYRTDNAASFKVMVYKTLNKPKVQTYLGELKQIGLATLPNQMARLLGAPNPGTPAVVAARKAALSAVKKYGWAKVTKKTYRDAEGTVTGYEETRTVDAAAAARTVMEDERSERNAELAAKATATRNVKTLAELFIKGGINIGDLAGEALRGAEDTGNIVDVEATPVQELPSGEPEPEDS